MLNTELTRELTIINRKGLHARAAAKVVKLCGQFQCDITFCRNDICAAGRSILDLLMLAAAQGKQVKVTCQGADAADALDAIQDLIGRGFDEEDSVCEYDPETGKETCNDE
ncbi:MAG TPA: HPr family phosphocarrier protein [Alphaproteobacteria bacterium]